MSFWSQIKQTSQVSRRSGGCVACAIVPVQPRCCSGLVCCIFLPCAQQSVAMDAAQSKADDGEEAAGPGGRFIIDGADTVC